MHHPSAHRSALLAQLFTWLVLGLLLRSTYAIFFEVPYAGLNFNSSSGEIVGVFVPAAPEAALQVGDRLIQVGDLSFAEYRSDYQRRFFPGAQAGQVIPIVVERSGRQVTVPWVFPGRTAAEIRERFENEWPVAYIFWLAAAATLVFVRPRDMRWRLLIAFNLLTAGWIISGGRLSLWHYDHSPYVLHSAVWLSLAVYLHLHWIFPQPLRRLPRAVPGGLYAAATLLAAAEWFNLLPRTLYLLGFLAALLGSLLLLAAHFIAQPAQRRTVALVFLAVGLAILPAVGVGLAGALGTLPSFGGGALLALPVLPLIYLYGTYRHELGGQEWRVNRAIGAMVFFILLGTGLVIVLGLVDHWFATPADGLTAALGFSLASALVAVTALPRFQRSVERRLLGIRLPPEQLLETYAARIAASPDRAALTGILRGEILSSLLVRESVLLHFNLAPQAAVLYATDPQLAALTPEQTAQLLAEAERYRPPAAVESAAGWVRLALPLVFGAQPLGLWLLGRRDPDDFYSQRDIDFLRTLAHQTSVALANLVQAERLQALYRADIDRAEAEREHLARELHDHVLGQLAALRTGPSATPETVRALEPAIARLRDVVSGLRPAMLAYGLRAALLTLADDDDPRLAITVSVPEAAPRYPPAVELHLFRIAQQACENARQHAQARTLEVRGTFNPDAIELHIVDDGQGFQGGAALRLNQLVAERHFGLAGMVERAALVGARVAFDSAPGRGTRVEVTWRRADQPAA